MSSTQKIAWVLLAFLIAATGVCVANFILQIFFIFVVELTRLNSSGAYVFTLWLVTGVFCTVFTPGLYHEFVKKKLPDENLNYSYACKISIFIGLIGMAVSIYQMSAGRSRDLEEFSLIFSNPLVRLAFSIGAGALGYFLMKASEPDKKLKIKD